MYQPLSDKLLLRLKLGATEGASGDAYALDLPSRPVPAPPTITFTEGMNGYCGGGNRSVEII